jgi:regulator of protease activity HflC (stomatin/prohibitin superfamily)
MSFVYKIDGDPAVLRLVLSGICAIILLIVSWMTIGPRYMVWSSSKAGEAELAQAEWNRQIIVRQAQAKKDAAVLEADAEVLRADGVSKANAIIANGLGGPEGYLRYLYIHMLEESSEKQIIYIPTEAGLPILEAGKRP